MEQVSSVFSGDLFHTAAGHFREFIKLMISGNDGLLWNSISPYGYAYPIALPFVLIGLVVMLKALPKREHEGRGQAIILIWLLVSVLMACVTNVNINRINVIFYPIILLLVAGFMWVRQKIKGLGVVSIAGFCLCFVLFCSAYFNDFPDRVGPAFYNSIGEAIQYASEESEGKVYITDKVNMPYIYALFMRKSIRMISWQRSSILIREQPFRKYILLEDMCSC